MSRNLIDRDVLLKKAKQEQRFYKDEYDAMESGYLDEEREIVREAYFTMTDCVSLINNAPIVDAVEVVHGEWIEVDDFDELIKGSVVCSNCRGQYQSLIMRNNEIEMRANKTPYCPNCGAKMDGKEQNDEQID